MEILWCGYESLKAPGYKSVIEWGTRVPMTLQQRPSRRPGKRVQPKTKTQSIKSFG